MSATEPAKPAKLESFDILKLLASLPHRYPLLLVDRIIEVNGDESCIGVKNVTFNEPHFQGHFPAKPIMPGVMVIEAMAQAAAVLVGISMDVVGRDLLTYFLSIDNCKFRRMVLPGDVLKLTMTVKRGGGKIWKFHGLATVDGQTAAEAEIAAMMDLRD